ncbi:MAG: hypothetical protein HY080_05135 [Gammaproteobacteria bacterium]|nr:hypothetical protein [Gammaproteobacteria bacterium]
MQPYYLLSLLPFVLSTAVMGAPPPPPIGIALKLESFDSDWRYDNNSVRRTQINSAALGWYEQLSRDFSGNVYLGYLEGTQVQNPITAAQITSGKWLGLEVDYQVVTMPSVGVELAMAYQYSVSERKLLDQDAQWRWYHGSLGLNVRLGPQHSHHMTLGVATHRIDGEEVLTGLVNQVENFKTDQRLGGKIELNIALDPTGRISIEIQSGYKRGGGVTFGRFF